MEENSDQQPKIQEDNDQPQQKMTDEERLALAAKLDKELDDFINGLEKKRYTDGWPEDRWQEEMAKHPFFMKEPPKEGDELHPLMEGIQRLKYDPEENTAEELALNYKEDGNFYMKHKKFRMAVLGYTEGLRQRCQNDELDATLHNNRSAAQFFLENYRSSLADARKALALRPDYAKARWRAAQCCLRLGRFDECLTFCDEVLATDPRNKPAVELRAEAVKAKAAKGRNERMHEQRERKRREAVERTLDAIQSRKLRFVEVECGTRMGEEVLKPRLPPLEDFPVSLDEGGGLHWPTAFCYPEFEEMEFQQQLFEDCFLFDVMVAMLEDGLPFDPEKRYTIHTVRVWFEDKITGKVHEANMDRKVGEIVAEKEFSIFQGTVFLYVLLKDSEAEKRWINQKRVPLNAGR